MATTVCIILDKRRIKKTTKKFPVKLKITSRRETRLYQTVFDLSSEEYESLTQSRVSSNLAVVRDKLKFLSHSAQEYVYSMTVFGFAEFEKGFVMNNPLLRQRQRMTERQKSSIAEDFDYSIYYKKFPILKEQPSRPGTIASVYISYIKTLLQEERIGTATKYRDSYSSIKKFSGDCLFTEITKNYLVRYENWMLKKGKSITTIGMIIRSLRAVFNEACEMRIIKKESCYPFGRRRYVIPTGRNIKKALSLEEITSIYNYAPANKMEERAKDFWFFCYFSNGMNPKDVAYLKFKNIQDGYLMFSRVKTKGTTRHDPKTITVYMSEDLYRIIDKWGNKSKAPDDYIFPIMDDSLNPLEQYRLVPAFTQFINDQMAKIGENLGIERKITTMYCRHSFSTQMKLMGASTEFIQEALGHMDKKTTENYLDSFGKETKKEFALKLAQFNSSNHKFGQT